MQRKFQNNESTIFLMYKYNHGSFFNLRIKKGRTKMNIPNNTTSYCNAFRLRIPVNLSFVANANAAKHCTVDPDKLAVLIKSSDVAISNDIGKIFKEHNIIDYGCLDKKPDESAFYQLVASSYLYKSELKKPEAISADNTTASLVCDSYHKEFFQGLRKSGFSTEKCGEGIYRIRENLMLDMYILVRSEMRPEDQKWLESLLRYVSTGAAEIKLSCPDCMFRSI